MTVCAQCGHTILEANARFCAACGAELPRPSQESAVESTGTLAGLVGGEPEHDAGGTEAGVEAAVVEQLPTGTALLVVRSGPAAGARFLLDTDLTTVGRHPDSHIFLDDITVSRRHAEFVREGSSFRVRDVGSLNGTYVNRERIDDVALANHDEVQIGKFRLVFLAAGAS